MLTPQEVSSHAFPKAVVGGYNMSSVDEFLDLDSAEKVYRFVLKFLALLKD